MVLSMTDVLLEGYAERLAACRTSAVLTSAGAVPSEQRPCWQQTVK